MRPIILDVVHVFVELVEELLLMLVCHDGVNEFILVPTWMLFIFGWVTGSCCHELD